MEECKLQVKNRNRMKETFRLVSGHETRRVKEMANNSVRLLNWRLPAGVFFSSLRSGCRISCCEIKLSKMFYVPKRT